LKLEKLKTSPTQEVLFMDATTTLADLATTHPGASRVFHRLRLDFCCGGRRPLTEACAERGLDATDVLDAIEAEDPSAADADRWDTRPIPDLVTFIVERYHDRLRQELPELVALSAKVEQVHADKSTCPRGLRDHMAGVHEAVLSHLAKEEQILFPMILRGLGQMAASPIRVMELEHDDHRENLMKTRQMTKDFTLPPEACATWRALYLRLEALEVDLMKHIHLENHVLFPRVLGQA
jgi:regulator of cell morphogenesis and NO signaling